jgi:hypothetical protein
MGRKFNSYQEVIKGVKAQCRKLEKEGLVFVFKNLHERWKMYIITEGAG